MPDHGKLAPWRFILFEGDARATAGETIASVFRADRPDATADQIDFERKRLARAPLVIAVVSRAGPHVKIPEWEQQLSAGASAMSLVFAAHAMGYAASWITEWYAYDRRVLDALGLSPNERIAGFVHIGRPAKPPEDRERPNLDSIVTRFGRLGTNPSAATFNLYVRPRAHASLSRFGHKTPPALCHVRSDALVRGTT